VNSIEKSNCEEPGSGFSIEGLGREGIRYREGNRSVCVWTEYLVPQGIAVSTGGLTRWDPPNEHAHKERILNNIKTAVEQAGDTVKFVP
jgi:hypothetical protein